MKGARITALLGSSLLLMALMGTAGAVARDPIGEGALHCSGSGDPCTNDLECPSQEVCGP